MRAFIHAFQGKPWNEECEVAYKGFQKLGIECVLFSSNEELDERTEEDIVVGGMLIMEHVLNQDGIKLPNYNYPEELREYLGRKIWTVKNKDLNKEELPIFVKPVKEKAAKGRVINAWEELEDYTFLEPEDEIICSEPIKFVSEWRCFIWYGIIVGIQNYYGDSNVRCNDIVLQKAVIEYKDIPKGCSLDFGVTDDGRTLLIEMNDGYSLGCYGLFEDEYAKLLLARWSEIKGIKDPFEVKRIGVRNQIYIGNYDELCPNRGYPFMKNNFSKETYPGQGKVIFYLLHGNDDMICMTNTKKDIFTGELIEKGNVYMNDGEYYWSLSIVHYVKRYNLRLPDEFEKRIMNTEYSEIY